ncbi:Ski complex subunit Rec14 [Friedmanniomyces endolithicus]|uniref:Ski complex subunit Rec14 n=1 Tax=Rachicladosporium monterosium TaxID=1507873 RepID=A0ABR0L7M1_9PEZI|nr:Ski complex subunit Rec14 [Friedmanniomyces endolithicus]KAK5144740.1 Ski complex subunit Rec14 [Rachicladosporium monterosium]
MLSLRILQDDTNRLTIRYLQTHIIPNAHRADIYSTAVTPSQVLSASGSSSIHIYSTRGQITYAEGADNEHQHPLTQTLEGVHPLGCLQICTSLDGRLAASAGFNGELRIWKRSEYGHWSSAGREVPEEKKAGEHWALALSENRQYLACTINDGRTNIYDTRTIFAGGAAHKFAQFKTQGSLDTSVDIFADDSMTSSGRQNGSIYIFNKSTARLAHSLAGLSKPVRSVRFSPTCKSLATAGDARTIALHDTHSGEQLAILMGHGSWIMSLDWNWNGEYLLGGGYDGEAKIWSLEGRERRAERVCGA